MASHWLKTELVCVMMYRVFHKFSISLFRESSLCDWACDLICPLLGLSVLGLKGWKSCQMG